MIQQGSRVKGETMPLRFLRPSLLCIILITFGGRVGGKSDDI